MFAVITLKFKQRGLFIKKIVPEELMERQIVKTLIRPFLLEQTDLGMQCLLRSVCQKT